jgi:hypothetical protein
LTDAGFEGQAYNFNGSGNYIQVPININPTQQPRLTMGAWVRAAAADSFRPVLSHDNGGCDRSLGIDWGGSWMAYCGSAGAVDGNAVVTDTWVFLAAVYDQAAETVKLWVDDKVFTKTGASLGDGHDYLDIGKSPLGYYFSGTIDNVFIFSGALSDNQIAFIRTGGSKAILTSSGSGNKALPGLLLLLSD